MVTITCGSCGIQFSIPEARQQELFETGARFYCPNGHPRAYNKGRTKEELKDDYARARREVTAERERAWAAEGLAARRLRALRTCPLCSRHFRGQSAVATHLVEDHGASDRPALSIATSPLKQIGTGA